jgi:PKD repeat protein
MHKELRYFAALAVLFLFLQPLQAQHYCGQAVVENALRASNPELAFQADILDSILTQEAQNMAEGQREDKRIIPVVFHIIHQNGDENINDDQVHSAIRIMNEDFIAINEELEDVVPFFEARIGNTNIELRLATIDPDGNPTTGIDRIESAQTNVGTDASKLNPWPRRDYYNIWVTNVIGVGGAAAYAYRPPFVPSASVDGVISNHRYVGDIGTAFSSGVKTLTHETAHFLNILHTWGGSNTPGLTGNCSIDDFVGDTPNCIGTGNGSCDLSSTTCGSLDNVQNFMDYASCESMFTQGQVNRMRAALNSTTAQRNQLWQDENLEQTGTSGLHEARYFVESNVACRGEEVQFYDESRYDASSWEWEIIGPETYTSDAQNPVFTFNHAGTYTVKLTVSNGSETVSIEDEMAFAVSDVYGAGMPFEEDFQDPKPGWAIDLNERYDDYTWELADVGYNDDASFKLNNIGNDTRNNRDLVFSSLDFRGMTSVDLDFRLAYTRFSPNNSDELRVEFSDDCGATWRTIEILNSTQMNADKDLTSSAYVPESNADWERFSVNNIPLTWLNERTMIRFRFTPGGGNNAYIDDINIDGNYEDVPYLVYPDNGAPSMNSDVVLDWRSVPGADAYELEISTASDFTNVIESVSIDALGDASDAEDTQHKATALENGQKYYWRVRADNGGTLSDWSDEWVFTVAEDGVGIADAAASNELVLYPNPAQDILNIQLPQLVSDAQVAVINVNGQLAIQRTISSDNGQTEQQIELNHLPNGVYFVKVESNSEMWFKRFVINR